MIKVSVLIFMFLTLCFGSVSGYAQARAVEPPDPVFKGNGFKDSCLGCLLDEVRKMDPNNLDSGQTDLNNGRINCIASSGLCKPLAYSYPWSPLVLFFSPIFGPPYRWKKYTDADRKAVCLYSEPYYAGKEYCYWDRGFFRLPPELDRTISSFWAINLKKLRFGLDDPNRLFFQFVNFDGNSGYNDGFNLLPKYNDKFRFIDFE